MSKETINGITFIRQGDVTFTSDFADNLPHYVVMVWGERGLLMRYDGNNRDQARKIFVQSALEVM